MHNANHQTSNLTSNEDRVFTQTAKIFLDKFNIPSYIKVPSLIIGPKSVNLHRIQQESGCYVQLCGDKQYYNNEAKTSEPLHLLVRYNNPYQLQKVKDTVNELIIEADSSHQGGNKRNQKAHPKNVNKPSVKLVQCYYTLHYLAHTVPKLTTNNLLQHYQKMYGTPLLQSILDMGKGLVARALLAIPGNVFFLQDCNTNEIITKPEQVNPSAVYKILPQYASKMSCTIFINALTRAIQKSEKTNNLANETDNSYLVSPKRSSHEPLECGSTATLIKSASASYDIGDDSKAKSGMQFKNSSATYSLEDGSHLFKSKLNQKNKEECNQFDTVSAEPSGKSINPHLRSFDSRPEYIVNDPNISTHQNKRILNEAIMQQHHPQISSSSHISPPTRTYENRNPSTTTYSPPIKPNMSYSSTATSFDPHEHPSRIDKSNDVHSYSTNIPGANGSTLDSVNVNKQYYYMNDFQSNVQPINSTSLITNQRSKDPVVNNMLMAEPRNINGLILIIQAHPSKQVREPVTLLFQAIHRVLITHFLESLKYSTISVTEGANHWNGITFIQLVKAFKHDYGIDLRKIKIDNNNIIKLIYKLGCPQLFKLHWDSYKTLDFRITLGNQKLEPDFTSIKR